MAEHKAPTQVSIAPLAEKSGFEAMVARYWLPAAMLGIGVAAAILYAQFNREQEKTTVDEHWDALRSRVDFQALAVGGELPPAEELRVLADELEPTLAGPWARALEIESSMKTNQFDQTAAALDRLGSNFPEHSLVRTEYEFGADDEHVRETIPERLKRMAADQSAWTAEHARLFDPPPLADDAPRIRLVTDRGPILVGLYPGLAPKHAENFLTLCKEGYYDGTLFHRVLAGQIIQGGDPNTRDEDSSTWGLGGPEHTIPPEISDAWHFGGMLAAARGSNTIESNGSQFYITAQPQHRFDKQFTVFGRVLEGMELVESLAADVPSQSDRPENPAILERTEVL